LRKFCKNRVSGLDEIGKICKDRDYWKAIFFPKQYRLPLPTKNARQTSGIFSPDARGRVFFVFLYPIGRKTPGQKIVLLFC